jgi:hypothetical protein
VLKAAKEEHEKRLGKEKYQTLMQPGQKPPLDYRNAPTGAATAEGSGE